jgi:carboxyl-terminal processing protease
MEKNKEKVVLTPMKPFSKEELVQKVLTSKEVELESIYPATALYIPSASNMLPLSGYVINDKFLVDEYSASAAEILAGAIQDQDRGLVVGRRTFGKGLVQRPVDLPDGSMIRLTISKYYTPSGRCIQKPYEKGKEKEYRMDVINRFNHGELTNADSIHFPDSLRFQTLREGRTVYGGGGIMPDYFVPLDTTKNTSLYRQIVAKRILIDANLRYLAKHRNELKEKYPTFEDFRRKYKVPEEIIENIYTEAKKSLKDKYPKDEEEKTTGLLKHMLRALAARDLWDMSEYFAIIYEDDDIVKKAVQLMEE